MAGFGYAAKDAVIALELSDDYVWDCSVIHAEGKYHLFCSRWERSLGFGWNWLYHSEIVQCVADQPQGPYRFLRVVLPPRGGKFFDGRNTHNPCIRYYDGKYYLYYMGTTYDGDAPPLETQTAETALPVWNRKRIGVAVANSIYGDFVRRDTPLLPPRGKEFWDCTVTTNPTVAILPSGKTYMIYKSRRGKGAPLMLGSAAAEHPDGAFHRLSDTPIFSFDDPDIHVEDPFLWYDERKERFCLLVKDDSKNGAFGITGEWGSGFYAESSDCVRFEISPEKVYSRKVMWKDGHSSLQGNMERPWVLFDGDGKPAWLFCATGAGSNPYSFGGRTFITAQELIRTGRTEK
ncbi:MAG: glycoside hydrolase family protein [Oscillospiraceae bacterium]|nr:glycoside hydrolase family protein [Oscillospiraceae bacterium]